MVRLSSPASISGISRPLGAEEIDVATLAQAELSSIRGSAGVFFLILGVVAGSIAVEEGARYLAFIDHGVGDRLVDLGWIAAGSLFIVGGVAGYYLSGSNQVVRIRIDSEGIQFLRRKGGVESWSWSDPVFRIDVCQLEGPAADLVPPSDYHRASPIWLEAYRGSSKGSKLETLLRAPDAELIVGSARRNGLQTSSVRAAFFWQEPAKAPGFLAWEAEDDPALKHRLNGSITRLRPSASGAEPASGSPVAQGSTR